MGEMTTDAGTIAVQDVHEGQRIRPPGWYRFYEVLAVEEAPDVPEFVKVLWFVGDSRRGPEPWPPGPYTYFPRWEQVEVVGGEVTDGE